MLAATVALHFGPVSGADPGATLRVAWLVGTSGPEIELGLDAFRAGLAEQGLPVGEKVQVEYLSASDRYASLPALANELVTRRPDIIVAYGATATEAAAAATKTIPIVTISSDPVRLGTTLGHARPTSNVTGLTTVSVQLAEKRLQLLTEVVPSVARVAVLLHEESRGGRLALEDLEAAGQRLGISVVAVKVRSSDELPHAFREMVRIGAAGVLPVGSSMVSNASAIAALALEHRLPLIGVGRPSVEAGGLATYGVDLRERFRRAAGYVARILRGTPPGDLPIEEPTSFTLLLNLRTAKALGLTVPAAVLARADEVIE